MGSLDKKFPIYSRLLKLYPVSYQKKYSGQMLQTLADMLDDPANSKTSTWLRAAVDLPVSIGKQQLFYIGENMAQEKSIYIKRTSLMGAWLIAPFFVFIIWDSLTNNSLNNSFFWHTKALFIWLILLPSLAVILNLAALLRWVSSQRKDGKISLWRALTDFRYNWPVLSVIIVGLVILTFVFGHDSTHCITGNPVREIHNPNQTWQCLIKR